MGTAAAPPDTFTIVGFAPRRDELVELVCALVAKRVTATSGMVGTTAGSAARLVSDALLIQAEMDRQAPPPKVA